MITNYDPKAVMKLRYLELVLKVCGVILHAPTRRSAMESQHTAIRYSLSGVVLLLTLATSVFSQSAPGPVDRVNTDRARQQEMSNREWQLRNFGKQPGTPEDRRRVEALMAQTAEDFDRILTRHNEIARALSANKSLDYNFVTDAVEEIRKRASRLQSTLGLRERAEPTPDPVTEKPQSLDDQQIKDELIRLCKQIRSFVTNPVIANPNTIDVEQMKRARKDLELVIERSEQIKKDTTRLSKDHD